MIRTEICFTVEESEAPAITTEGNQEALQALLPVEHHAELSGRIAFADLRVVELPDAVRYSPEGPRWNPREIFLVDLPEQQRAKRPATQQRINEERDLAISKEFET